MDDGWTDPPPRYAACGRRAVSSGDRGRRARGRPPSWRRGTGSNRAAWRPGDVMRCHIYLKMRRPPRPSCTWRGRMHCWLIRGTLTGLTIGG